MVQGQGVMQADGRMAIEPRMNADDVGRAVVYMAKTPPEIIRKMHADTVAALNDQATKERLEQLGVLVVGSTPEQLAAFLKAEMDKWAPVIKEAGISIRE
jgi:tripartite-type tricarboxylate transporter receptor subunit TctC